jgi:hypothetical protein
MLGCESQHFAEIVEMREVDLRILIRDPLGQGVLGVREIGCRGVLIGFLELVEILAFHLL